MTVDNVKGTLLIRGPKWHDLLTYVVDVYLYVIGNRLKSNNSVSESGESEDFKVRENARKRKKPDITPEIRNKLKRFKCEYSKEGSEIAPKGT